MLKQRAAVRTWFEDACLSLFTATVIVMWIYLGLVHR